MSEAPAPSAPASAPPAPAPSPTPASQPPSLWPSRPAAAPTAPAPASPPAAKPAAPSAVERFQMSPEQRRQLDAAERRAFDPWTDPARLHTRAPDGIGVLVDGKPAGDQAAPGETPATAPAETAPESRDADPRKWTDAEVAAWQAREAAEQSKKLALPQMPESYKAELPLSFKPPAAFSDYKVDSSHPLFFQAQQFAHKNGLTQEAFSEMLALAAGREIGTAEMLRQARAAEIAKLGATGTARVSAIENFLISKVGAETYKKVAPLLATEAAVRVYEKWMEESLGNGGGRFSGNRGAENRTATVDDATYNKMSYSEKKAYAERMSGGR
jgi:hypothetical protein